MVALGLQLELKAVAPKKPSSKANRRRAKVICASFWRTWVPLLGASDTWSSIDRRDRARVTNLVDTGAM